MSNAAAEACTQLLAAGRGTGIGLQHVNDDQSMQRDKPRRVIGAKPLVSTVIET